MSLYANGFKLRVYDALIYYILRCQLSAERVENKILIEFHTKGMTNVKYN